MIANPFSAEMADLNRAIHEVRLHLGSKPLQLAHFSTNPIADCIRRINTGLASLSVLEGSPNAKQASVLISMQLAAESIRLNLLIKQRKDPDDFPPTRQGYDHPNGA